MARNLAQRKRGAPKWLPALRGTSKAAQQPRDCALRGEAMAKYGTIGLAAPRIDEK
jgi:hypothetical protein